jgi:hypothetical protein
VEALVVIIPDPDIVTLNYTTFSDAVSRVNTSLANAYTLTCEGEVVPLYANPAISQREILTASGEYALQDSTWKPEYIVTDTCPSVIIRLWFERTLTSPSAVAQRMLRGILTQDDQAQMTQSIRGDVVPLLQSGQYKIIIWMNGQQTPVETVQVVNLIQTQEENALAANAAVGSTTKPDSVEMYGGIAAGIMLVAAVVAVVVVRRAMKKTQNKEKRLKETAVEIMGSQNPMTLLQPYHPRISVGKARRLSPTLEGSHPISIGELHPSAVKLDMSPMENPLKHAAAIQMPQPGRLPIDMSPRTIDPQHFTKVKKTFAGQLARPTEVFNPQERDRTPVTDRLSMRPSRSMVTAASLDVNPMAAYKNREMFNAMHSRNGRRLAAKVTGQKPTIE